MWFNRDSARNQYRLPLTRSGLSVSAGVKWVAVCLLLLYSLATMAQTSRPSVTAPDSNCSDWFSAQDIERWLAKWPEPNIYPDRVIGQKRNFKENEYRLCMRSQPTSTKKIMAEVHFGMTDSTYQEFDKILMNLGYTKINSQKFLGWNQKTYYTAVWTKNVQEAEGNVANTPLEKLAAKLSSVVQVPLSNPTKGSVPKPIGSTGVGNATGSTDQLRNKPNCRDQKLWQMTIELSIKHVMSYINYHSEQKSLSLADPRYKPLGIKEFLKQEAPEIYQELIKRLDRRCSSVSSNQPQSDKYSF